MSVRVMHWVWTESSSESTDRLVLLAIADCANDDGRDAYPSLATLAAKARLHKRTVQRSIDHLVAIGELAIQEHGGPGRPNRYRVTMRPGQPSKDGGTPPTKPVGTPPIRQSAHTAEDRQGVGTPPTRYRPTATTDVGTVPTEPSVEPPITVREPSGAQTIVAEWIDRCQKRPPKAVIGQIAKQVAALLGEGIDPDDVRRGIAQWMTKDLHPSVLPSIVNSTMNGRASPLPRGFVERDGRPLKAETAANLDLIERMRALDEAQPDRPAIERRRR